MNTWLLSVSIVRNMGPLNQTPSNIQYYSFVRNLFFCTTTPTFRGISIKLGCDSITISICRYRHLTKQVSVW